MLSTQYCYSHALWWTVIQRKIYCVDFYLRNVQINIHLVKSHSFLKHNGEDWRMAFGLLILIHEAHTKVEVIFVRQKDTRAGHLRAHKQDRG